MTIKVLQLGTCGPLYGAERWILALASHLDPSVVESHIAVIVDTPGVPVPLLDEAARLGLRGHTIAAPGRVNLRAVSALRRLARDYRVDVVHSHGYKADLIALLAVRGTTARTVATPHGWSRHAGPMLRLYEWLDRQSFRWFDAVAPLSPDLARGLQEGRGGVAGKLHLIPNGVDLGEVEAAGTIPNTMAALRQKGPVLGYVGQLIARKDLATLIGAFAQWSRDDAQLVLVGDGDLAAALRAQAASLGIAGRTHFVGFRADRLDWMRGFDAFVLPSQEEGIPRCLMEAMALGVPVIASDIPGNSDLVTHGVSGQLFPVGDAARLAACFAPALDPAAGQAWARTGKDVITSRFSARIMAAGYERLFHSLIG